MYSISSYKYVNKNKLINKEELNMFNGFLMGSKNRIFKINNTDIRHIIIVSRKLANPIVSKKVFKKFNKLLILLTDLIVDDDESGESCREALNQIEKFRLEIKNKYREFLKKKELEMMSKQLITLQKEATKKFLEIQNSYYEMLDRKNSK